MKRTDLVLSVLLLVAATPVFARQAVEAPGAMAVSDDETISPENSLEPGRVKLDGDIVEYKADEGKFVASGNVVVRREDATLYCDRVDFFRDRQEAHAEGAVVLETDKGTVWADKGFYNFQTRKGEFTNARIMASPFFGKAVTVSKVGDNYYVMSDGFFSTSDYDDPEWRVKSRQIEVWPGDRVVAHASTMYLGGVPVAYAPRFTKNLKKNEVHISIIPGYKKDFGAYILTSARTNPLSKIETTYHFDYRELKYLAGGVDVKYAPTALGEGLVKTYYMDERTTHANRGWESSLVPTDVQERYRVEWRHQVTIDPTASVIGQYYKMSDPDIVKTYFEREYRQDEAPTTYMILTKVLPYATASVRTDVNVNRFDNSVQRLPELNLTFNNQPIGDTGLYFKSNNTASNLMKKDTSPENRNQTVRVDTDNELSRPFKLAFLEMRPFVGTEHTLYTKTLDSTDDGTARGIFRTGMDIGTKFYRVYDVEFKQYGIDINKLRHIINPTVAYLYAHDPTMSSSKLYQYDPMDARTQTDQAVLALNNTLQTKSKDRIVDLIRSQLSAPYLFNDNVNGGLSGRLGDITLTDELYPNKYITLHQDATYDNQRHHVKTANWDLYLKDNKKWEFDVGKRYAFGEDDLLTTQLTYTFNPKWRVMVYDRIALQNGQWQEQRYALVRDLHSWEVEFDWTAKMHQDFSGNEVMIVFRLKAFPTFNLGGSTGMSRSKTGPGQN